MSSGSVSPAPPPTALSPFSLGREPRRTIGMRTAWVHFSAPIRSAATLSSPAPPSCRCGSLMFSPSCLTTYSWAPATADPRVTAAGGQPSLQRRFVSGGCDNAVRIWSMSEQGHWDCQTLSTPEGVSHVDWVRDVAWAPNIVGLPMNIIASCAADKRVIIWTVDGSNVQATQLPPFDQTVWRVSWSATGSVLAVVVGDSRVLLFKNVNGEWRCVQTLVDQHQ
mmetsp:Transcript_57353/g.134961  ORF Transcript_57353/g.134961 Transcript_57353/m.134961 type:complete len:222 (-) Transcript_57353:27-692(-)